MFYLGGYNMIRLWEKDVPGFNSEFSDQIPGIVPYLAETEQCTSAVIVFPGGGYNHKAAHEGEPVALWLNSIGISAFVLEYRVYPYQHPYPLLDAQRAVRYVRYHAHEWKIDPNRIGVLGFSAGGHLASTVGTHFDLGNSNSNDPVERMSCRPDAMILCYPVITFGEFRHDGSMKALLGDNPSRELVDFLSNETQVTSETPPAFLWHTANDQAVPVENSLLFASALSRNKIPFELHIFPDGRHGLGLAQEHPQVSGWTGLCEKWLESIGFTKIQYK